MVSLSAGGTAVPALAVRAGFAFAAPDDPLPGATAPTLPWLLVPLSEPEPLVEVVEVVVSAAATWSGSGCGCGCGLRPAGHRLYQARLRCGLALFGSGLDQRIASVACGIGLRLVASLHAGRRRQRQRLGRGAVMPLRFGRRPRIRAPARAAAHRHRVVVCPELLPAPAARRRYGLLLGRDQLVLLDRLLAEDPVIDLLAALHRLRRIAGGRRSGRRARRIDLRLGARLGGSLGRGDHRNVVIGRCRRCRQVEVLGVEEDQHADDHRQRQQCQQQDQRPAAAARLFLGIFLVIFAIGVVVVGGLGPLLLRLPPAGRTLGAPLGLVELVLLRFLRLALTRLHGRHACWHRHRPARPRRIGIDVLGGVAIALLGSPGIALGPLRHRRPCRRRTGKSLGTAPRFLTIRGGRIGLLLLCRLALLQRPRIGRCRRCHSLRRLIGLLTIRIARAARRRIGRRPGLRLRRRLPALLSAILRR